MLKRHEAQHINTVHTVQVPLHPVSFQGQTGEAWKPPLWAIWLRTKIPMLLGFFLLVTLEFNYLETYPPILP